MESFSKQRKRVIKPVIKSDFFSRIIESEFQVEVVKELKFHPQRNWRIDYAIDPENTKIALEVEGGVFTNGRHTRGKGFMGDMEKYNNMTILGWKLIRVTPTSLLNSSTLEMIQTLLSQKCR